MFRVSELYTYPIKSLGGVSLKTAEVTEKGIKYDRRWMLVDEQFRFLSQREVPKMAQLKVEIVANGLFITDTITSKNLLVPFQPLTSVECTVTIWGEPCTAVYVGTKANKWFSEALGIKCRLVYMPDSTKRKVDENHAPPGFVNSFADGYPFLIVGQASLDDLNSRLSEKLPMNRFRPNIVFTGGEPFEEDKIDNLIIDHINFYGVKLCARCVITTIDQENIRKYKEPLKTLSKYRRKGNDVFFGQNLIHKGSGTISVGDELKVLSYHNAEDFII
ncbi:MOSC domain-containing protein [Mucilaginibacter sp.]